MIAFDYYPHHESYRSRVRRLFSWANETDDDLVKLQRKHTRLQADFNALLEYLKVYVYTSPSMSVVNRNPERNKK